MINRFIESVVCEYYGVTIQEAMNSGIHTRKATEARYFIWYFLRFYHRVPVIMMSEIYGFSRRQVHSGISFIREASHIQKPFIITNMELRKRLGYSELPEGERKRMYAKRDFIAVDNED